MESYEGARTHAMALYLKMASEGLDVTSIITHRFPIGDWKKAFRTLSDRTSTGAVKVLLTGAT